MELEQGSGAFTDYFVVCSGTNPRQVQAIADEVELRLKKAGLRPNQIEGYKQAEWVLLDYVDFVVHVFSEKARKFYDLERLWKSARRMEPSELAGSERKTRSGASLEKEAGLSLVSPSVPLWFNPICETQSCLDRQNQRTRRPVVDG